MHTKHNKIINNFDMFQDSPDTAIEDITND